MPGMLALLIAKLNDVLKAILPLIAVVCVLQVALVGAPAALFVQFLAGSVLAIFGMLLLFAGIDLGILPMGRFIGAELPQKGSVSAILGVALALGFATTVATAAGPVMSMYLLMRQLPKEQFVATGAWFFFVVNVAKLPIYGAHHLFSSASLLFDFLMVPAVVCGAAGGFWAVPRIPQRSFDILIIVLTAVTTIFLFR